MTTYKEMKSISFDNGNTVYNITDASVGNLSSLTTPDKTNIVSAINSMGNLSYTAKCPAITPVNGIATWVITHNMGSLGIVCSLYTKTGVEIVKNTTINSANQITVTFNTSVAVAAEDYTINILANGGATAISNHAQLDNLDYAHAGHTGFMKDDASNLTTDGQKVFDGQWVGRRVRIFNGYQEYPKTEEVEWSLADYLPDDNFIYEVNVSAATRSKVYNITARVELKSDIFPQLIVCQAEKTTNESTTYATGGGSVIIPVGIARKLILNPLNTAGSVEYALWVVGYRRIGTNQ